MVGTNAKNHRNIGYCLGCGTRITRCGAPFTADILCHKCGRVNVYDNSNKPRALR
jgi:hypothetical protein